MLLLRRLGFRLRARQDSTSAEAPVLLRQWTQALDEFNANAQQLRQQAYDDLAPECARTSKQPESTARLDVSLGAGNDFLDSISGTELAGTPAPRVCDDVLAALGPSPAVSMPALVAGTAGAEGRLVLKLEGTGPGKSSLDRVWPALLARFVQEHTPHVRIRTPPRDARSAALAMRVYQLRGAVYADPRYPVDLYDASELAVLGAEFVPDTQARVDVDVARDARVAMHFHRHAAPQLLDQLAGRLDAFVDASVLPAAALGAEQCFRMMPANQGHVQCHPVLLQSESIFETPGSDRAGNNGLAMPRWADEPLPIELSDAVDTAVRVHSYGVSCGLADAAAIKHALDLLTGRLRGSTVAVFVHHTM